jgi:hypothetical protein
MKPYHSIFLKLHKIDIYILAFHSDIPIGMSRYSDRLKKGLSKFLHKNLNHFNYFRINKNHW